MFNTLLRICRYLHAVQITPIPARLACAFAADAWCRTRRKSELDPEHVSDGLCLHGHPHFHCTREPRRPQLRRAHADAVAPEPVDRTILRYQLRRCSFRRFQRPTTEASFTCCSSIDLRLDRLRHLFRRRVRCPFPAHASIFLPPSSSFDGIHRFVSFPSTLLPFHPFSIAYRRGRGRGPFSSIDLETTDRSTTRPNRTHPPREGKGRWHHGVLAPPATTRDMGSHAV